ncbi:hypothetical protein [Actinokineospora sp. HUAS TT18]|uniref:hypothetical protein n=1 Tax=Actinokineospora sp. HUAS TT18 TaxID=3447451 RepID=UPI003F5202BA
MLPWLCVTFGVALGSALVPLVSIELFVLGLMSQRPGISWLALGAVVAVAQMAGKLLYYYAARGSFPLPKLLHRQPKPLTDRRARWQLRTKRVRAWLEAMRERCERHPGWMFGTYGVSSLTGLPPFMAMTVLAGLVRMPLTTFVSVGLVGRWARFSALAASPALFAGWFL